MDVTPTSPIYYAFISYSRRDLRAAQYIQKGLERFKYSNFPVQDRYKPRDPHYLRKIFLDKTDLTYRNTDYRKGLKKALDNTRYLIVICSYHSRKSIEVQREIETFLSNPNHKESHIIPVVLNGHVGKKDNPLPQILNKESILRRNMPIMRVGRKEREKVVWQDALSAIISAMTRIPREHIHNRYLEEKYRHISRMLQAAIAIVGCMIFITLWAFYERFRAEEALHAAEEAREHAQQSQMLAEQQKNIAQEALERAEQQKKIAEEAQSNAERQQLAAEKEKQKAQSLFEAGKDFSNEVIFRFADRLADVPRASQIKHGLISSMGNYLNHLEKHSAGDSELLRLIVASKNQMGDVSLKLGNVTDAETFYKEAFNMVIKQLAAHPNNSDWQRHLFNCYAKLGNVYREQGNRSKSQEMFQKGFNLIHSPAVANRDNTDLQRDLSMAYNNLGDIYLDSRNLNKALYMYDEGLAIITGLSRMDPYSTLLQRDRALIFKKIGDVYRAQNDLKQAERMYVNAYEIAGKLSKADPDNTEWKRDLSIYGNGLGDIYYVQKNLPRARDMYEKVLEIRRSMVANDPGNTEWSRDLSVSCNRLGSVFLELKEQQQALNMYHEGLKIAQKLVAADPDNRERLSDVAYPLRKLGLIYQSQGNLSRAENMFTHCMGVIKKLVTFDSGNKEWQYELGLCHLDMALLERAKRNGAKKTEHLNEARRIMAKLHEERPDVQQYKQLLDIIDGVIKEGN